MTSLPAGELNNWIPWKLSGSLCEWLYIGNKKFTEPFFDDTIATCRRLEENSHPYKVHSDLALMAEWAETVNALTPAAIIFHVSRCGSTLLSQLLSLDETHIVLSEVPVFDELLRLPYKKNNIDTGVSNKYLSAAIKYYGRKRSGNEKNLFIKTDSWHLHFYSRFRNIFPSVPFILLYRNPREVILSQQKQRGMQSVPGMVEPQIFGFSENVRNETNLDLYMVNVLKSYFRKMIEIVTNDPLAFALNYNCGIRNIVTEIYTLTHTKPSNEANSQFEERMRFDAKNPQKLFAEDDMRATNYDFLLQVQKLYKKLEALNLRKCQ